MSGRTVGYTALAIVAVVVAAACSGGSDDDSVSAPTSAATESTVAPPTTKPLEIPDYASEAASFPAAPDDASLPPDVSPDTPVGSYGFSRYVWSSGDDDEILPTLVEGPRGLQFRCQDEALPCSYVELSELAASGAEPPAELGMSRDELVELVSQLDQLSAKLAGYEHPDQVCAEGYMRSSSQNPNMGIHMTNNGYVVDGFVVDAPEILLLAKEGGETLPQSEVGQCEDGRWTGDPAFEVVGAAFMQLMTPEHPDGFAGPIDNWHIHYNTCAGAENENRSIASQQACEEEGGAFQEVLPVWMMHAYAVPEFDSQQGVFSMFNGSIWPVVDNEDLIQIRTETDLGDATQSPINNFAFEPLTVAAGEEIVFTNSDSVPHTVTQGSPATPTAEFDSGVIGTGGQFAVSFDDPGEYELFCALHPQMTGTVVVEN